MSGNWAHGLCGCFSNCGGACMTWCCPCVVIGQNAEAAGQGSCLLHGCLAFVPFLSFYLVAKNREMIREQNNIPGGFGGDCATVCCCPCCAVSQQKATLEQFPGGASMQRT